MESRASNQKILNYLKEVLKKKDVIESLNKAKSLRESVDINSYETDKERNEFEKILEDICDKYDLPKWTGSLVLERLIIEGFDTPLEKYEFVFSTCSLGVFDEDKKLNQRERDWLYEVRPIKITISPHASIDDIKKFIDKHSNDIKELQDLYRDESTKIDNFYVRSPQKQKIYDFVFENQDLSYKDLMSETNKTFGTEYGYDTIGRMVRRENKKRGYGK